MINKTNINPYLNNLSLTGLWSISSFIVNILPIYFLNDTSYANLIISTTLILLISQINTLGFSDSILKYGYSSFSATLIILISFSSILLYFFSFGIVFSSMSIAMMIAIRNHLIKNNLENKIFKFMIIVVFYRIFFSIIILSISYSLFYYLLFIFIIPSSLVFLYSCFFIDKEKIEISIKRDMIYFSISTVLARFLYTYSNRIGIFILNENQFFDEIKVYGFLLSFLGVYSFLNQSIRNVLIGKISSSLKDTKNLYLKLIENIKKVILLNLVISTSLTLLFYFSFSWETLIYLKNYTFILSFVFLFFTVFGIVPFLGLFNLSLRTINRIDLEIFFNLLRLVLIYIFSFYFEGLNYLISIIIIFFTVELFLAYFCSKYLFKWTK